MKASVLFVGLGNPLRGDDGVGWALTEKLRAKGYSCSQHRDDLTRLLDDFQTCEDVIIVDAMEDPKLKVGESRLIEGAELQEFNFGTSTHSLGLKQTFDMAEIMGCTPSRLRVYAINGKNFKLGDGLSEELDLRAHLFRLEELCTNRV